MESDSYFDARTCYEDGLRLCSGTDDGDLKPLFSERIDTANRGLAERNLTEAEHAYARGDADKAIDHLELVKTLILDPAILEKADKLLLGFSQPDSDQHTHVAASSSCASCSGSPVSDCTEGTATDDSLPPLEYYELLIQQLPIEQYQRYAQLGEDFAYAYIAASRDDHQEALTGFEKCSNVLPQDIYWYEKGKVQHRLGNDDEAEQHLRMAVQLNGDNSLAWITLALVLAERSRFQDALAIIESMVASRIMPEQALLLRADIYEATGDHEGAVSQYVELLETPYARAAAEKLYEILMETGRQSDAAVILKKYLKKSCH